jgi:prostaglandin-E synthase
MSKVTTNAMIPNIKWAQRKDKLFITIDATEVKDPKIDILDGRILKFEGSNSEHVYSLEIELYDEVVKEESKNILESRNIFLNIKKKTKGPYWPRLIKDNHKYNWIRVDWRYFLEEDEEEEDDGPNFGNGQSKKLCFKYY